MAFELDMPAALKVGPVKLTKPRVTLRPFTELSLSSAQAEMSGNRRNLSCLRHHGFSRRSAHHPSGPFATVAVEGGFGVRRRQSFAYSGAVPHPDVLGRHPQHPRERPPAD